MRGDHRTEVVHPAAHGLVRHRDLAPREQILDVTKAECEPEVEPNRLMYDLGRKPISGVADFPHTLGYSAYAHPTRCGRRDKAVVSLTGIPSRLISRSDGRPPALWPSNRTIPARRAVRRANGAARLGTRSVKMRRSHSWFRHLQRPRRALTMTGAP